VIRFTGYGVIAEKPHVGQLGRIFPCTLWEKCMRWIEKWLTPFWRPRRAHHAKFGEDRTTRAGCRCENMVFVCLFFCHTPRPARCSFEGDIFWTGVVSRFMGRFWYCLRRFSAL